jgi:hypothetical protein
MLSTSTWVNCQGSCLVTRAAGLRVFQPSMTSSELRQQVICWYALSESFVSSQLSAVSITSITCPFRALPTTARAVTTHPFTTAFHCQHQDYYTRKDAKGSLCALTGSYSSTVCPGDRTVPDIGTGCGLPFLQARPGSSQARR